MRKQFYLDLMERLSQMVDENDKPIFKHLDLWNRQFEDGYKGAAFKYPAVFLEFANIPWNQEGQKRQSGHMVFNIHIAFETLTRTDYRHPQRDASLLFLDIVDAVHYQLDGWRTSASGRFTRLVSAHDHYFGNVQDHVETYTCKIIDESAMHALVQRTINKLVLTLNLK